MGINANQKPSLIANYDGTTGIPTSLNFVPTFFAPQEHNYKQTQTFLQLAATAILTNQLQIVTTTQGSGVVTLQSNPSGITNGRPIKFQTTDGKVSGIGILNTATTQITGIEWSSPIPTVNAVFVPCQLVQLSYRPYPWIVYVTTSSVNPTLVFTNQQYQVTTTDGSFTFSGNVYYYDTPRSLDAPPTGFFRCVPTNPAYSYVGDAIIEALSRGSPTFNPGRLLANREGSAINT